MIHSVLTISSHQLNPGIVVLHNPHWAKRCAELAKRLSCNIVNADDALKSGLAITCDSDGRLGLVDLTDILSKPAMPNFETALNNNGKDTLMRAIGYKTQHVLDCTAGWGRDAAHIAQHEISITSLESNPVMIELLNNAIAHCTNPKILRYLAFKHADAVSAMTAMSDGPEVIYLDPMYPPKPGSAATKKPLQLLHKLIANNSNVTVMLNKARHIATKRVVVKRPHYAEPVAPGKSGDIRSKLVRFDIYPPL